MADPEEYRTKEQVEQWRRRDPIELYAQRLREEGLIGDTDQERLDAEAVARVDAAVAFADASPFPTPDTLYDDVYKLGSQVHGWYSVDTTHPEAGAPSPGEPAEIGEVPQRLTEALEAGEDT